MEVTQKTRRDDGWMNPVLIKGSGTKSAMSCHRSPVFIVEMRESFCGEVFVVNALLREQQGDIAQRTFCASEANGSYKYIPYVGLW